MHPYHTCSSAEARLTWCETTKVASCRASLCRVCELEPADADAVSTTTHILRLPGHVGRSGSGTWRSKVPSPLPSSTPRSVLDS